MGIAYNTNIVRDGLAFHLDGMTIRGNKPTGNILSQYPWSLGTESEVFYNRNGTTGENERVIDTNPFGDNDIIWQSPFNDSASNGDGGWNTSRFPIDPTKMYRFSTWTRKKDLMGDGRFYLGVYGYDSSNSNIGLLRRTDGANNTNYYFHSPRFDNDVSGNIAVDEWVLSVGFVWPQNSGTGSVHPDQGIYNMSGTKVYSGGSRDAVWNTGTTQSLHRTYQYYSTTTNEIHQWWHPRVDVVDGTEPTIKELLNGIGRNWSLTKNGTDVNQHGSYWQNEAFQFEGGEYISLDSAVDIQNKDWTIEAWVKRSSTGATMGIVGDLQYNWLGLRITTSGYPYLVHGSTYGGISETHPSVTGTTDVGTDWCQIVGSYSYSAGQKIYCNGILENTNSGAAGKPMNLGPQRGPRYIGRSDNSSFGTTPFFFTGQIANVKIYQKELTSDEVKQNFNALRGRYGL